ncbi:hypothetical protein F4819DRAFT_108243 [Hypoxylon fuscum]|nr:hypothetical protein F4819DRAFT_108243 [Hypoxylon fuscum]
MSPSHPGKGLLDEKAVLITTQTTNSRHRVVDKMPSARHFFLTLFLGLLLTAGLVNAVLKQQPSGDEDSAGSEADHVVPHDDTTFSRLLSSASPQTLHEFLHAYFPGTYKHGVYDSDHSAIEAIRANDPELATSIVQMAKRQQSGNDTTAVPTSTQAPDSSSVAITTETSITQETLTSESTSESPTSPSESTTTVVETSVANPTSSTDSPTLPTSPTSPTSESAVATSTPGSTLATTTTPSTASTVPPKTSTFVSTLPGGAKTTITSVEVVTPGAPEEASTTAGSSGSLQSGLAVPVARKPIVEMVIGVVVGGVFLV